MANSNPIQLSDLSVDFDDRFQLSCINWQIEPDQHWMITGTNGSGKSALAAVLAGVGEHINGTLTGLPANVAMVSYEAQGELIEAERRKDDADILDVISEGTPVHEMLEAVCKDDQLAAQLIDQFGLTPLLDRAFRKLSTGETRKVLLVRALTSKPDLLVLDEPFDGLDAHTHQMLLAHLTSLAGSVPMVLVLNRLDECPEYITNIAYLDSGELKLCVTRNDKAAYAELYQLLHMKTTDIDIPAADSISLLPPLDPEQPLVRIRNGMI